MFQKLACSTFHLNQVAELTVRWQYLNLLWKKIIVDFPGGLLQKFHFFSEELFSKQVLDGFKLISVDFIRLC